MWNLLTKDPVRKVLFLKIGILHILWPNQLHIERRGARSPPLSGLNASVTPPENKFGLCEAKKFLRAAAICCREKRKLRSPLRIITLRADEGTLSWRMARSPSKGRSRLAGQGDPRLPAGDAGRLGPFTWGCAYRIIASYIIIARIIAASLCINDKVVIPVWDISHDVISEGLTVISFFLQGTRLSVEFQAFPMVY